MRPWLLLLLLAGCPQPPRDDDDTGSDDDSTADDDADDDSGSDDDTFNDDDTFADDDTGSDDDDTEPVSPCEAILRQSNIGCEFYAVDLDNAESAFDNAAAGQFAVAVSNVSDVVAVVVVDINTAEYGQPRLLDVVDSAVVDPGELHIFRLPRRDVDGEPTTPGVDAGTQTWLSSRAFRITSDAPIVAYQFNPIDQRYSNDASLLYPTHTLGQSHHVLGYPPNAPVEGAGFDPNRAYVTVVGVRENTEVRVRPTADIMSGTGVPDLGGGVGISAGQEAVYTLGPFDVLNLETKAVTLGFPPPPVPDLTGTVVTSDAPVAVFFGTDLSLISSGESENPCCAEHLEQQVLPDFAVRNTYVVSHSGIRSSGTLEDDVYRVMGLVDGTTVTTNLPGGEASFTLNENEFREFQVNHGFVLTATSPVHVVQFLVTGLDIPVSAGTIGDNSMLPIPPVAQRREDYTFVTGEGFSVNYAVINAAQGVTPQLDGNSMAAMACRGPFVDGQLDGITYQTWDCPIEDGVHEVHADGPVAVYVYGYYGAGSYAYPAGAGLAD